MRVLRGSREIPRGREYSTGIPSRDGAETENQKQQESQACSLAPYVNRGGKEIIKVLSL